MSFLVLLPSDSEKIKCKAAAMRRFLMLREAILPAICEFANCDN